MGLDALDIQFRIEKTFQISLTVDEMRSLLHEGDLRVGDLYDFLLNKLTLRDRSRYDLHLNYELWRNVQRSLQVVTNRPMEEITLDTRLEELFPRETRRVAWAALQAVYTHGLPKLQYHASVHDASGLLALVLTPCLLAAGVWGLEQLGIWSWVFWPLIVLVGLTMVFEIATKSVIIFPSLRTELPARMVTVKDFCRVVLADNYKQICQQGELSIDKRCLDVWHKLQVILQEALGVERTDVTFKSRLIRDLGMS